jgi:hypothetical protein
VLASQRQGQREASGTPSDVKYRGGWSDLLRQPVHLHVILPMGVGLEEGRGHFPTIRDGPTQGCLGLLRLRLMGSNALLPDLDRRHILFSLEKIAMQKLFTTQNERLKRCRLSREIAPPTTRSAGNVPDRSPLVNVCGPTRSCLYIQGLLAS